MCAAYIFLCDGVAVKRRSLWRAEKSSSVWREMSNPTCRACWIIYVPVS